MLCHALLCIAMWCGALLCVILCNNAKTNRLQITFIELYSISITEMQTTNGINSQLSITHSDRIDSGSYRCIAENPFGKSEHVIYVAVQGMYNIPIAFSPFRLSILHVFLYLSLCSSIQPASQPCVSVCCVHTIHIHERAGWRARVCVSNTILYINYVCWI